MKRNSSAQEDAKAKLGLSMFLICFSFIFFSSFLIIYQLVLGTKNRLASIFVLCLYWFQFYSNFILYAILNMHYRKAFYFFLQNVLFCRAFCCQDENTEMRNLDNSVPLRKVFHQDISSTINLLFLKSVCLYSRNMMKEVNKIQKIFLIILQYYYYNNHSSFFKTK